MNIKYIALIMLVLCSCYRFRMVRKLVDQKDAFVWKGSCESKNYTLTIDDSKKGAFHGRFIINSKDTLYLDGFEKGSSHPTLVIQKNDLQKLSPLGYIFMWTKGKSADTVVLRNDYDSLSVLPIYMNLYKERKTKRS